MRSSGRGSPGRATMSSVLSLPYLLT
uniref:Uncharacterized protein n=1 Tax=Arundo donax TaxID=35708 RepID=A0A0A9CZT3_ARUDO